MSFYLHLDSQQIYENHKVNIPANLFVKKEIKVIISKVKELIRVAGEYEEGRFSYVNAYERFYRKFRVLPFDATEEMRNSDEYKAIYIIENLNRTNLETIHNFRNDGYRLVRY